MGELTLTEEQLAQQEIELYKLAWEEIIEDSRSGILPFTIFSKPEYEVNWHHKFMGFKLNQFLERKIRFMMVFMPPRHGKSELTSRRLPAMIHGRYPDDQIIAASYSASLAADMCKDVQRIIDTPEFSACFPNLHITAEGKRSPFKRDSLEHELYSWDKHRKRRYKRGSYLGGGIQGAFTGKGGQWLLIDDPFKNRQEADSVVFRKRVLAAFQSSLLTRLEKEASILLTMTRWHEGDLAGELLEEMKMFEDALQFEVINFPAIKENDDNIYDPRKIGEPLWPGKFSLKRLMQLKRAGGPREWGSLYQQRPTIEGGGLFESRMFKYDRLPNSFDYIFSMSDTSYNDKQENDYTAVTVFGMKAGQLYVIASFMKRIKAVDAEAIFKGFLTKYAKYPNYRGTYIEPKGHGIYLNKKLSGLKVPSESKINEFFQDRKLNKVERANNAVPHLFEKSVIINENIEHKDALVAQALAFPNANHDDFVDTLVDGIKFGYGKSATIFDLL